ncbi:MULTISPECIES: hypothetical protein [unclassified Schlesneria]|uniref:hypothetical protein n=1 Tax=unclassified Schlesneria TaxID=2762017 RepID=UPI002EE10740
MSNGNHDQFRLGFLTAVEDEERGYVGGLLITNRFGRPLEFQCTSPVKPNRTQQILYGPTLRPYVLGELIGRTLLEKVGVKPHLIMVETSDLLDLRSVTSLPVASLPTTSPDSKSSETAKNRVNGEDGGGASGSLRLGKELIAFHASHPEDRTEVENYSKLVPGDADLREPFERVREALVETLRLSLARPA